MKKWLTKVVLAALALLAIFLIIEIARSPGVDGVQLYFFDVGQGDSILIQKGNYQILIDGGPDDEALLQLGRAMPLIDRNIEVLILTHPHADHLTGINQILERYKIDQIYFNGTTHTSNGYLEFLHKIKDKNITVNVPVINQKTTIFENAELTFLSPGEKYKNQSIENLNNTSEVVKFCYYSECALLLGDLETDGQGEMFAELDSRQINYQTSILKIAHHGSTNGTDQTTLDKIKPQYAVIEVGADNKFGHPHAATIDLLNRAGVKTYRTDRDGTVEFVLKEGQIEIK